MNYDRFEKYKYQARSRLRARLRALGWFPTEPTSVALDALSGVLKATDFTDFPSDLFVEVTAIQWINPINADAVVPVLRYNIVLGGQVI